MKVLFQGAAVLAAGIASPAVAADTPSGLLIVIETLDENSALCGITESGLESAVKAAMRYNRIAELSYSDDNPETLYVVVSTMHFPMVCVSDVSVSINGWAMITPSYSDVPIGGFLRLSNSAGMISTNTSDNAHHSRVYDFVKENFERALVKAEDSVVLARATNIALDEVTQTTAAEAAEQAAAELEAALAGQ